MKLTPIYRDARCLFQSNKLFLSPDEFQQVKVTLVQL